MSYRNGHLLGSFSCNLLNYYYNPGKKVVPGQTLGLVSAVTRER